MSEVSINEVTIQGRIYGDPVSHYSPQIEKQICKFQVEVGLESRNETHEITGSSTLIPCVLFNSPSISASLVDGTMVKILGVLRAQKIEDEKKHVTMMNVVVKKVIFIQAGNNPRFKPNLVAPKILGEKRWRK